MALELFKRIFSYVILIFFVPILVLILELKYKFLILIIILYIYTWNSWVLLIFGLYLIFNSKERIFEYLLLKYHLKSICKWMIFFINLNKEEETGETILQKYLNSSNTNHEILEFLLYSKTDPNLTTKDGNNLLHLALMNPHIQPETVSLLIGKNCDFNGENKMNLKPYMLYFQRDELNEKMLEVILDQLSKKNFEEKNGNSLTYIAGSFILPKNKLKIFEKMIDKGVNVNDKDAFGRSSLHLSSSNENLDLNVIQLLLQKKSNVNGFDSMMNTPLHYAAKNVNCNPKILKCLVENNAKVNLKDKDGNTALHLVCLYSRNQIESVILMLSNDCEVDCHNKNIQSAWSISKFRRNVTYFQLINSFKSNRMRFIWNKERHQYFNLSFKKVLFTLFLCNHFHPNQNLKIPKPILLKIITNYNEII